MKRFLALICLFLLVLIAACSEITVYCDPPTAPADTLDHNQGSGTGGQ